MNLQTVSSPCDPQAWVLATDVHAATVEGDVVFLDVSADAYSCLPGAAGEVTLGVDLRTITITEPSLAAELAAARLIAPWTEPTPPPPRRRAPPASASALRDVYAPPQASHLAALSGACLHLALKYRDRALAEIIRDRSVGPKAPRGTLEQVVDDFHRWVPYAPVSGKCLLRSFMLRRLLDRAGHAHAWVFGVSTWPFEAHCWLQAGDTVLDDAWENVSRYQPIMVL